MLQIFEDMPGAKATATTFAIDYNITGAPVTGNPTNDYNFVRAALLAYAPISNAPPGSTYAWPRRGMDLREAGWGCWKATMQWASLNYQYAYKISGSSQQVRSDKSLSGIYTDPAAPAGSTPSYAVGDKGRPIGWDGRSVHGCSVWVPTVSWTETVEIPSAQYSFDYQQAVAKIAFSPVNNAPFRGYATGQVLFQGFNAQFDAKNPDFVTGAYEFSAGPSYGGASGLPAINIDAVANIAKQAWDWLDVHYQPQCPAGATAMQPPKADFVLTHRVYDSSDFSGLHIGTSEALPVWQG